MTEFLNQIGDSAMRLFDQCFERTAEFSSQVRRHPHRIPIPFCILVAKSISLSLRQIISMCEAVPFHRQEFRAIHHRQAFLRIEPRSMLLPRINEVVILVLMRDFSLGHNFRLPVLLTLVNRFLKFSRPLSLCEFGLRRRPMWMTLFSVAAWLPGRLPDLGTFLCRVVPLSERTRSLLFHSEKSPFVEVDHDHGT